MPHRDPDKQKAYQAAWRAKNKEHIAEYSKRHKQENKQKHGETRKAWLAVPENVERKRATSRRNGVERRRKLKERIFEVLGRTCVRCGFSDTRALQIDHINGGGKREWRKFNNADKYYENIIELGRVKYQMLCANCNQIKRFEEKENR